RATRAVLIADHTSSRRAAFAASTSAGPPASRSCRGTERAIPPSCPPHGRTSGMDGTLVLLEQHQRAAGDVARRVTGPSAGADASGVTDGARGPWAVRDRTTWLLLSRRCSSVRATTTSLGGADGPPATDRVSPTDLTERRECPFHVARAA